MTRLQKARFVANVRNPLATIRDDGPEISRLLKKSDEELNGELKSAKQEQQVRNYNNWTT